MNTVIMQTFVMLLALLAGSSAFGMMATKKGQEKLGKKLVAAKQANIEKELNEAPQADLNFAKELFWARCNLLDKVRLVRHAFRVNDSRVKGVKVYPLTVSAEQVQERLESLAQDQLMPWLQEPLMAFLKDSNQSNKDALLQALARADMQLFNLVKQDPKDAAHMPKVVLVPVTKPVSQSMLTSKTAPKAVLKFDNKF